MTEFTESKRKRAKLDPEKPSASIKEIEEGKLDAWNLGDELIRTNVTKIVDASELISQLTTTIKEKRKLIRQLRISSRDRVRVLANKASEHNKLVRNKMKRIIKLKELSELYNGLIAELDMQTAATLPDSSAPVLPSTHSESDSQLADWLTWSKLHARIVSFLIEAKKLDIVKVFFKAFKNAAGLRKSFEQAIQNCEKMLTITNDFTTPDKLTSINNAELLDYWPKMSSARKLIAHELPRLVNWIPHGMDEDLLCCPINTDDLKAFLASKKTRQIASKKRKLRATGADSDDDLNKSESDEECKY